MPIISNDDGPFLLTVKATAERLGCSQANVYALIESGELPVVQVGRRKGYRVDVHDLQSFINQRKFRCVQRSTSQALRKLKHVRIK